MFTKKVIDLSYLNEISKGDKNFIKEMIDIFLSETPEEIKQLEEAIAKTNFEKIRAVCHHMKSTVPFVGLDIVIGKELAEIENLALERKGIEIIVANFSKIKTTFQQAYQELGS